MSIPAGARLGAYEVLQPLGAGGMGEVYRARDPRLGRDVAIKVLPDALADDRNRLVRFEQEARAASALNHPNIVTIYEFARDGDTAFIAMELVEGKTLRELQLAGPMPVRKALHVAAQVAEGLARAHTAGIVHRDLKPENVMVTGDGLVKILDFGLVKTTVLDAAPEASTLANAGVTTPGTVLGTVGYMSPEQASGHPADYRSDQFALGTLVHEMLSGKRAWKRGTPAETLSAIIREEPEPMARLRPDVPAPVRWILERCLAKDREERFASTQDLARDLASVRDHISELSSGSDGLTASPGISRRRRSMLVGIGLVAAVLSGFAAARFFARPALPAAPRFERLTFRRGSMGNARFAPGGQTIVYSAQWAGEPLGARLYLTRPGSPESQSFDFGTTEMLSISRTGELALLQSFEPGAGSGMLAVAPLTGGAARKMVENVVWGGADWTPDGKQLAVVRRIAETNRLEFPVGRVLVAAGVETPRFSPGGDRIAFAEYGSSGVALTVVDPKSGSKQTLSSGWDRLVGVPAWTPDGREIWFTASRAAGEAAALFAVERSGKLRSVLGVPGSLELYDIAPDGRVLLAHHTIVRSVRGAGPGESKERELAWLDQSTPADLSADGRLLLINELGEGSQKEPSVYLRGIDGSAAVRLGQGRGLSLSPNGEWVLALGGHEERLILLPTGAGQSRVLDTGGLTDFIGGCWLIDGKGVVFSASEKPKGPQRIFVLALDGKPRPVGPVGAQVAFSGAVSRDGKYVAGFEEGRCVIYPLDGAEEAHPVPGVTGADFVIQWSSDSRSLFVVRTNERPIRIWRVDVASGQRTLWKELPVESLTSGWSLRVRVTPDGQSYVYGFTNVLSELYLVEGLR